MDYNSLHVSGGYNWIIIHTEAVLKKEEEYAITQKITPLISRGIEIGFTTKKIEHLANLPDLTQAARDSLQELHEKIAQKNPEPLPQLVASQAVTQSDKTHYTTLAASALTGLLSLGLGYLAAMHK